MSRETALRAYFETPVQKIWASRGIGSVVAAALLLLVSLSMVTGSGQSVGGCAVFFAVPGILLGLWGGGRLWQARSSYRRQLRIAAAGPGDEDVQSWLDQDLGQVRRRALQALGLSDEELVSDLLTIVAPVLWSTRGIRPDDLLFKAGRDGRARFGVYSVAAIALTERHLGIFRCEYNFVRDEARNETTCEYHYRDIVSVSTSEVSSSLLLPSGEELTTVQEFRVSVPNGEAIRITVDAPAIRRLTGTDALPSSGAEKAVRAIRTMLRQKKA